VERWRWRWRWRQEWRREQQARCIGWVAAHDLTHAGTAPLAEPKQRPRRPGRGALLNRRCCRCASSGRLRSVHDRGRPHRTRYGKNPPLLSQFFEKTTLLPRQARQQTEETLRKVAFSAGMLLLNLGGASSVDPVWAPPGGGGRVRRRGQMRGESRLGAAPPRGGGAWMDMAPSPGARARAAARTEMGSSSVSPSS